MAIPRKQTYRHVPRYVLQDPLLPIVAIPLPSYFEYPQVLHSPHALSFLKTDIQISLLLQIFIFTISIALWNKLHVPADLVLIPDLDSFKTGVSKISHTHP